jgi:hypothetical protein
VQNSGGGGAGGSAAKNALANASNGYDGGAGYAEFSYFDPTLM